MQWVVCNNIVEYTRSKVTTSLCEFVKARARDYSDTVTPYHNITQICTNYYSPELE